VKAEIPKNEADRIQALRSLGILDTPPEVQFDQIVNRASEICGVPIALVSLVDANRQWFKAKVGIDAQETHRDLAFCAHAILQSKVLVVEDATSDPRFADNPLVMDAPGIRFYAGAPLVTSGGEALGTLCAIDTKTRGLSDLQKIALEGLAREVVLQMELRKRVRELEDALIKSEAATQAKSQFLANMSHEIRTPLAAILGYAEAARDDGVSNEDCQQAFQTILSNGRHLQSLLNDILDLSKLDAGAITIERVSVSPVQLCDDVRILLAEQAAEKAISLIFNPRWPLPALISTDPTKLKQILLNLVGNALKFTERGFVSVEVGIDTTCNRLAFKVKDSGIGISTKQLTKLFKPFSQADESTTRRFGGTGLGLSISHQLVAKLGGELTVESEPGKGSEFSFSLPLSDLEVGATITEQPKVAPGTAVDEALDISNLSGRILIADDAADNRKLLQFLLRKSKIEAVFVTNGQEALDAQQQGIFDLVLMDMQMPVMDGHEATRLLRERGVQLPIVAFTAAANSFDVLRCMQSGCTTHLGKPFKKNELYGLLQRLLTGP
jgi:signal transduction histidine kinase